MTFTPPNIPSLLKDKKQWLVWRSVTMPGDEKPRKVPFYTNGSVRGWPNGKPADGKPTEDQPQVEQGDPRDIAALATFGEAVRAVDRGYTGLGFAPVPGGGIVALDFDNCVNDGVITDSRIEALISDTYAEYSPSGTGLRAFYRGDMQSKKDNANSRDRMGGERGAPRLDGKFDVEFFGHNGFVTVTGNCTDNTALWGMQDTVADVSVNVHKLFVERFGPNTTAVALSGEADLLSVGPVRLGWTLAQAREYLFECDASASREEWLNALMAIHYEFDGSDEALDLVDEWSATGDSYAGRRDVEGRWHSFGRARGAAPITGRWLLAWRRERMAAGRDDEMRGALQEMGDLLQQAPDMVAVQTRAMPRLAQLLLNFPQLEIEAYHLVAERTKSLGTPITKSEFRKLIKAERPAIKTSAPPLTEFGNCDRMLAKYHEDIRYCADADAWYVWNGNHWAPALGGDTQIQFYAKETVKQLPDEAHQHIDQGEFYAFCAYSQRKQMVEAMVKLARSDPRICIPSSEMDKTKRYLGVKNGVVDLWTGELLAPRREFYITRTTSCEYNPGAKAPNFEKAMNDAFFGDKEMIEYVLRMFGYALQGEPKEDLMFIAFGAGSNGKSTIFNAVEATFGAYAKTADKSTFLGEGNSNAGGPREDLLRLRGARYVRVTEPEAGEPLRESIVKALTSDDDIVARGVNARITQTFKPTWAVFMPTNHKPIIKGTDNGIWRRMCLIPFIRNFDTDTSVVKDVGMRDKVIEEKAGILNLLVKAGLRYRQMGLKPPAAVKEAVMSYRKDMDLLTEWIEECCIEDPNLTTKSSELWESWETFARRNGNVNYIKSSTALGRQLDGRFPAGRDAKGARCRVGIGLRAIADVF